MPSSSWRIPAKSMSSQAERKKNPPAPLSAKNERIPTPLVSYQRSLDEASTSASPRHNIGPVPASAPSQGGRLMAKAESAIDALLSEKRVFPPPPEFTSRALWNDPSIYERAAGDPEGFWAEQAESLS